MATEPSENPGNPEAKPSKGGKLELLYPLGMLGGVMALLGAALVDGTSPFAFINLAAFLIVVIGASSAVLVQFPFRVVKNAFRILPWAIKTPHYDPEAFIEEIIGWARQARIGGLLSLEALIAGMEDPFIRKGLQMAVDGMEPSLIGKTLRLRLHTETESDMFSASLFEALGGYSPTFGIMGAVTGLIEVMHQLSNPSNLGAGIAAAFVSTIYGLVFANVVCIPTGNRLKAIVAERVVARNVFVDGIIGIVRGTNTSELREVLMSYYLPKKKGKGEGAKDSLEEPV